MYSKSGTLDLVIRAMLKLNHGTGERQNVNAFIQSCYGGMVRRYDFDAALNSLKKLSEDEEHALIEYVVSK